MLHSLVYVSKAAATLTPTDLLALRDQAVQHNEVARITGLLMHRHQTFLQDLEGPEANVLELYERIERDPRHRDVTLVWSRPAQRRRFPRWSMALTDEGGRSGMAEGFLGDPLDPDIPEAAFVRELLGLFDTGH